MSERLDELIARLAAAPLHRSLDGLDDEIVRSIAYRRREARTVAALLPVIIASVGLALATGVAVGSAVGASTVAGLHSYGIFFRCREPCAFHAFGGSLMDSMRSIGLTVILSGLATAVGISGGAQFMANGIKHSTPLHEQSYEELRLNGEQKARIAAIERGHDAKRKMLMAEMRAANSDLARAFQRNHAYTQEVQAAIDRFHFAMSELQKETMLYTLTLRAVLTGTQAAKFDEKIVQSLVQNED